MSDEEEGARLRRSCVDCGTLNCEARDRKFPEFCLTEALSREELDEVTRLYTEDPENRAYAVAVAEIEAEFYGRYTRVEETIEFARRIGAKKIGVATCAGLINESRTLARILRGQGFEVYSALCKVGSVDKTVLGADDCVLSTGPAMCNPIMQARILAREKVDLNIVMGLCVGHDTLFYKYAVGPVTTLVCMDRVLAHNPAAALYLTKSYYGRLLERRPTPSVQIAVPADVLLERLRHRIDHRPDDQHGRDGPPSDPQELSERHPGDQSGGDHERQVDDPHHASRAEPCGLVDCQHDAVVRHQRHVRIHLQNDSERQQDESQSQRCNLHRQPFCRPVPYRYRH